ncbi:MAG: hypothetical protein ABIR46_04630 [Candidatus Saccharimonadales bacterium]
MIEYIGENWITIVLIGLGMIFFVFVPLLDWKFGILDDPTSKKTKTDD